ncbi:DUF2840 domain-containing protein [Phenylobacterium sp.]|jgi:hypothetical protein|uniref:DUF2840 domain-containing protein n=1 Tax=Phenylobacterium sp. TaxID=1871053 RepID=UPI002F948C2C
MLTEVELVFHQGVMERWIRFGRWTDERIINRRRRVVCFAPGELFALVRWQAGEHGTLQSRIDILRAVPIGEAFTTVPFVAPGAEVFAHVFGWPKVQKVLEAIEAVEAAGVDPRDCAPEYWRHVASRVEAGLKPRAYGAKRHRAWLLRKGRAG